MLINNIAKLSHPARNATSVTLVIIAALAMYKWTVSPQSGYLSAAKGYESAMDSVIKYNKIINIQVEHSTSSQENSPFSDRWNGSS